jgi:hypothetical protein
VQYTIFRIECDWCSDAIEESDIEGDWEGWGHGVCIPGYELGDVCPKCMDTLTDVVEEETS